MQEQEKGYNFRFMKYFDELKKSMSYLAKNEKTIFIGQAVEVPGTAMSNTLKNIPKNKLFELPVAEEMQMGITLGLAMDGNIPVSIFPRWNFLLYGMNQLINHLDKFNVMMGKEKNIKTIIRTGIGSQRPLHPQHQHIGDFTESIKKMCSVLDECVIEGINTTIPFQKEVLKNEVFLDGSYTTNLLNTFEYKENKDGQN